jgi:FMN-dependent NADH-azoreductase
MWNFGVPYRLKQYLDVLIQPTHTFSFSPSEGYKGLVTGKPLLIVSARGGEYAKGTKGAPMNFQQPYLELAFGFMGFTDIQTLEVEPTLAGGPKVAAGRKEEAIARAREIAENF